MQTLTIDYPDEVLQALQQDSTQFEQEARMLLALKLYETGKLTTSLAAKVAGLSRTDFILSLGQYGLSAFGGTATELEEDLANTRNAKPREDIMAIALRMGTKAQARGLTPELLEELLSDE